MCLGEIDLLERVLFNADIVQPACRRLLLPQGDGCQPVESCAKASFRNGERIMLMASTKARKQVILLKKYVLAFFNGTTGRKVNIIKVDRVRRASGPIQPRRLQEVCHDNDPSTASYQLLLRRPIPLNTQPIRKPTITAPAPFHMPSLLRSSLS